MAGAVADRTWRESAPESIESDLAALWREIGQTDVKVARAVMSNLIVVRWPSSERPALTDIAARLPLDDVAARHPSRTIVLEHCPEETADTRFAAGVAIVTFGPASARYGVEQIVVRSACPGQSLLSILRRLVRGDVPTSVWWTEDLSARPPAGPLLTVGRQLVYDSGAWGDVPRGLAALSPLVDDRRIDLADLNWRRFAPLRRALLHVRGPLNGDGWRNVTVRIAHDAAHEAMAWLLAGWIRSERRRGETPVVPERASPAEQDAFVTIVVGDATATVTSRTIEVTSASRPPLVLAVASEVQADAVAAELRSLAPDVELLGALRALR
jgi:glucose-6-phosphate dehydrogenase assembly protein OpcA